MAFQRGSGGRCKAKCALRRLYLSIDYQAARHKNVYISVIITNHILQPIVIAVSSALTLYAAWPYLRDTARGETKPRVASWLIWAALLGIAAAASYSQHQWPAAIFTWVCCLECLTVVALGFKSGDRRFGRMDLICMGASLIGLAVLLVLKAPTLAVIITIVTDLTGGIPTIAHSWSDPHEETPLTYLLSGIASLLVLLVANFGVFTAYGYPLYMGAFDLSITYIVFARFGHTMARPKNMPSSMPISTWHSREDTNEKHV